MKRRGFLKLLGLLPFAPALAEAATKTINKPEMWKCTDYTTTGFDPAVSGADQTSIWISDYGGTLGTPPTLLDVAERYNYKHMLPVIETLNQKNPLLQDVVWQEKNVQLGHRVNWGSRWIGKSRRLM